MNWKKEFSQTKLIKQGGACFECCDYEGIVKDIEAFISKLLKQERLKTGELLVAYPKLVEKKLSQQKEEMIKRVEELKGINNPFTYHDERLPYKRAINDILSALKGKE